MNHKFQKLDLRHRKVSTHVGCQVVGMEGCQEVGMGCWVVTLGVVLQRKKKERKTR